ncbi:MAG: UDP-N-acetylmuramoyl-tripeptide--D-alanyl-D-alanine ligase [Patescibacteria group bacterium]|jgi:UDP-N-acetylmuramoyl-tripeptide--D-alanyl-D-alanine ligase
MKQVISKILQSMLYWLAKLVLWRQQPEIIGITGSVGKTSTKTAIAAVLSNYYSVRMSSFNYNNELGVPLTIIGSKAGGKNPLRWLGVIMRGLVYGLLPLTYPKILILEMGADHPGDIKYLTQLAPARIGMVTCIGDQPAHLAFFKDVDQLAQEKLIMLKHLTKNNWAILNLDEPYVQDVVPKLKCRTLSFSLKAEPADLQALDIDYSVWPKTNTSHVVSGLRFKLRYQGNTVPCFVPNVVGLPAVYAAMFAIAVGLVYELNFVDMTKALQSYQAPPGRLCLISGINNTLILDDTYNASPAAMREALNVLAQLTTTGKKIACLGNMEELGSQSKRAHTLIGKRVAELKIDYLFTLGDKAESIAIAALDAGLPATAIAICKTPAELISKLTNILAPQDIVLMKGSQAMRLEKIAQALMEHPEQATKLLARQYGSWTK